MVSRWRTSLRAPMGRYRNAYEGESRPRLGICELLGGTAARGGPAGAGAGGGGEVETGQIWPVLRNSLVEDRRVKLAGATNNGPNLARFVDFPSISKSSAAGQ